ncbi:MAG: anaerobic ribonucleoside-triphosphate reductase activating protein [Candidatus Melainabacteria bacterium]|nr:anaerobic ribonucleoside-triphosphate reductase activating protein [Candidatus Melainabacteria bacterium]
MPVLSENGIAINNDCGDELIVGGMVPFSANDYPGCLSAVVFCQGCPWRCRYCHNSHLQSGAGPGNRFSDFMEFFRRRVGVLDAVVFSGGEPTWQEGIGSAIRSLKAMGFKVGMHTSGYRPSVLSGFIDALDWVGLDIKAPPEDYHLVTNIAGSGIEPFEALKALLKSNIDLEVRTTVHPRLIDRGQLLKLARLLAEMGVQNYAVQEFRAVGCNDFELNGSRDLLVDAPTDAKLSALFPRFTLRQS